MKSNSSYDALVIGAGFAGAATALHLCKQGLTVLVVDMEKVPGVHSSGRSAAMIRALVFDQAICQLSLEGARFFLSPDDDFPVAGLFKQTGGIYAGDQKWRDERNNSRWFSQLSADKSNWLSGAELRAMLSFGKDLSQVCSYFCPEDGVVDAGNYLNRLFEQAGPRLTLANLTRAVSVRHENGRVTGIDLTDSVGTEAFISCPLVVNAAGSWADQIAATAGLAPIGLTPKRRHLFQTSPCQTPTNSDEPFFWHESAPLYLRPESGGWLLTACDEKAEVACSAAPSQEEMTHVAEVFSLFLPTLTGLTIKTSWAGHRTFSTDGRFVLGPDPRLEGFHWCAGLGGHGVTCAWPSGKLVASTMVSKDVGNRFVEGSPFGLGRLLKGSKCAPNEQLAIISSTK